MADVDSFLVGNGYSDPDIFGDDSSKIKSIAVNLNGIITDIVLCDYNDRQFLIITQHQKIGTIISATKGTVHNLNGFADVFSLKTISGLDKEEYHLATRYLAEQLDISKPVLFSISLKDHSLATLKSIVKVLKEYRFY